MLFAYNAIRNVIRLRYTVRRGINDMPDDMHVTVNMVKMVK